MQKNVQTIPFSQGNHVFFCNSLQYIMKNRKPYTACFENVRVLGESAVSYQKCEDGHVKFRLF